MNLLPFSLVINDKDHHNKEIFLVTWAGLFEAGLR